MREKSPLDSVRDTMDREAREQEKAESHKKEEWR